MQVYIFINSSVTLGFKFQILPKMEENFKFIVPLNVLMSVRARRGR
jgi:hypothetical protein